MPTNAQNVAKAATPSTREHLIEVGLELMRKCGYGATGLQDILNEAKVPKEREEIEALMAQ